MTKRSLVAKYINMARTRTRDPGIYAYRGQENADWIVESAASRRIRGTLEVSPDVPLDWESFIKYHENDILTPARMDGYGIKDGRELGDLELLADLQHFGAATCLIDYTSNFLSALWFACKESKMTDGKVFIMNINDPSIFHSMNQKYLNRPIKEILEFSVLENEETASSNPSKIFPRSPSLESDNSKSKSEKERHLDNLIAARASVGPELTTPYYWHWSPRGLNRRILKQDSLFVFGKRTIDNHRIKSIIVKNEDKKGLLSELKNLGISRESLFKDLPGFASLQGHGEPISISNLSAEDLFLAGNEAFQSGDEEKSVRLYNEAEAKGLKDNASLYFNRGSANYTLNKYDDAVNDLTKFIKLDDTKPNPYAVRGLVYSSIQKFDYAIKDFTDAINRDNSDASTYFLRGIEYTQIDNWEKAIKDFTESINIDDSNAQTYFFRGIARKMTGDQESAMKDFTKCIELDSTNADAYHLRGSLNRVMSKFEDARSDLTIAFKLAKDDDLFNEIRQDLDYLDDLDQQEKNH